MPTPNPADMLEAAEEILNNFWPIITTLSAISLVLFLISTMLGVIKSTMGITETVKDVLPAAAGSKVSFEPEEYEESYEPDVRYVTCSRCGGTTAMVKGTGVCQFCGVAL